MSSPGSTVPTPARAPGARGDGNGAERAPARVDVREAAAPRTDELVRVYVWEWPVRITHWLIALSIVVLSVTGYYIGHPFVSVPHAPGHFTTGWIRIVHFYAAIVFTLSLGARIVWMFAGNRYARWDQFIPLSRERRKMLVGTFLFYVWRYRKPPGVAGHNPLAAGAYVLVYALEAFMVLTGLALYGAESQPGHLLHAFAFLGPVFGGLATTRWMHHVVMYLLLGFAVHHVYSSWLVSVIEKNGTLDSIFSGRKVVSPAELAESVNPEDIEQE